MTQALLEKENTIVIVDDLKNSHKEHIQNLVNNFGLKIKFYNEV